MRLKYFPEIDLNQLEDYYSTEIEIDHSRIELELNFESEEPSEADIKRLNDCLNALETLIKRSWQSILEDYQKGEEVAEFISFHLEDIPADDLEELLQGTDPKRSTEDRFLQTLRLEGIALYSDSPESYLVLDWMTDPDVSNYILVLSYNEDLELEEIGFES